MKELEKNELMGVDGGLLPIVWFALGLIASELLDRNNVNDFNAGYYAATGHN